MVPLHCGMYLFPHCGNTPIRAEHKLPMINVCVHNYVFYVCVCSFLPPLPFLLSLSELSYHDMRNANYMKRPWLEAPVWQPQVIIQLTSRLNSQICWVGGWATCTSSPGKPSCHFRPTAIWLQSYERPQARMG